MPESWIALTEDHVGLNNAERTAYRESLLASGATDRLPQILKDVVMQVRGAVRSCRNNVLAPDPDLIPESAVYYAGAIARYRLMTNFPGGISEARTQEYKDALAWLKDVAACRFVIESPGLSEEAETPRKARPSFTTPTPTQGRDQANG
jgi:hypothetical protein